MLSYQKHTLEWWNERKLNAVYGLNTKASASGAIEFDIYANELQKNKKQSNSKLQQILAWKKLARKYSEFQYWKAPQREICAE